MKIASKQKLKSALQRLEQGAGAIPLWARGYHIRRLQRAISHKKN
jgi:hypothetical protein